MEYPIHTQHFIQADQDRDSTTRTDQAKTTHLAEIDRVQPGGRELYLGPLRVLAQVLRLHVVAAGLHVQRQPLRLARHLASHVEIHLARDRRVVRHSDRHAARMATVSGLRQTIALYRWLVYSLKCF